MSRNTRFEFMLGDTLAIAAARQVFAQHYVQTGNRLPRSIEYFRAGSAKIYEIWFGHSAAKVRLDSRPEGWEVTQAKVKFPSQDYYEDPQLLSQRFWNHHQKLVTIGAELLRSFVLGCESISFENKMRAFTYEKRPELPRIDLHMDRFQLTYSWMQFSEITNDPTPNYGIGPGPVGQVLIFADLRDHEEIVWDEIHAKLERANRQPVVAQLNHKTGIWIPT